MKNFLAGTSKSQRWGALFFFLGLAAAAAVIIGQHFHLDFLADIGGIVVAGCVIGGGFSVIAQWNRATDRLISKR